MKTKVNLLNCSRAQPGALGAVGIETRAGYLDRGILLLINNEATFKASSPVLML